MIPKLCFFPLVFVCQGVLLLDAGSAGDVACAADQNHAGVVVHFSVADENLYCVGFSETEITGIRALRLTGLPLVTKVDPQFGEFVCKIGNVGTDISNCPASDGSYWSYYHLHSSGVWTPSSTGASMARVRCGSGDGWAWFPRGAGTPPSSPTSFATICPGRTCGSGGSPSPGPEPTRSAPGAEPSKAKGTSPRSEASPGPSGKPLVAGEEPGPEESPEESDEEHGPIEAQPSVEPSSDRTGWLVVIALVLVVPVSAAAYFFRMRRS